MACNPIIGIVGGMGPEAGLTLLNSILCHTPARIDQEHLSTIMMSFPGDIADRTSFLEGATSTNPAFKIAEVIRKLESAGASIIGIACNTSYSPRIYDVIVNELTKMHSEVHLLNMPRETCRFIAENYPHVRRVGVISTNGTYRSQVYKKILEDAGFEVVVPDPIFQNDIIHRIIYDREFGIKSNPGVFTREAKLLMDKAFRFFERHRSDALILGCTELSTVITGRTFNGMPVVDSTRSMALALIREATAVKLLRINTW